MTTAITQAENPHKRRGAPLGNMNAARHGMRGSGLPAGCGHIRKATLDFRRQVESEVLAARGEITLADAACINTAFRAERHAQLAQRWLSKEAENMTPADRLNYSREVVKASEARDKAIAALDLPKRPALDPWGTLTAHLANGAASSRDATPTSDQTATSNGNSRESRTEPHSRDDNE